jgi:alkylation response protein AidB-like acyl-CoA dehydrogenase
MGLPGIEVRDIANPFVAHLVHEVWFTDVPVPVSCLLGEENKGWEIVRQVLANERVGVARAECTERTIDGAVAAAEAAGTDVTEEGLAEVLGMAYATCEAARAMNYAAVNEKVHDEGGRRPLAAVSRALTGPMETTAAEACMTVLGEHALVAKSPAVRQLAQGTTTPIAAGSLEVQLTLVARLCLDLPKG